MAGSGRKQMISGADRTGLSGHLREDYETGLSVRALAGRYNRSYGSTYKLLQEAGTPMRGRGGALGAPRKHAD